MDVSLVIAGVITAAVWGPVIAAFIAWHFERDMDEEWFIYQHSPDLYRDHYHRDHP